MEMNLKKRRRRNRLLDIDKNQEYHNWSFRKNAVVLLIYDSYQCALMRIAAGYESQFDVGTTTAGTTTMSMETDGANGKHQQCN